MTYVVRRPGGGFEVRQSRSTPRGPRSRSLAGFTVLTDGVLARVRSRTEHPLDAQQVRDAAVRAGAPVAPSAADRAALDLAAELAAGRQPAPGLRRTLLALLRGGADAETLRWAGAGDQERGRALWDLLLLADRLPRRRIGPLRFPTFGRTGPRG